MSDTETLHQAASDIRDDFGISGGPFMFAIALWLDAVADLYADPSDRIVSEQSMWDHALAVANAYLSEEA